jgi:hypothetical protein
MSAHENFSGEKDGTRDRLFRSATRIVQETDAMLSELMSMGTDSGALYYLTAEGRRVQLGEAVDNPLRLKLCIVEIMLKNSCDEALEFLVSIPYPRDRDNLLAIFWILLLITRKHGRFDTRTLQKCKTYFQIGYLKRLVSRILVTFATQRPDLVTQFFTFNEMCEMGLWSSEMIGRADAEGIRCFFRSINSKAFKRCKKVFKDMDTGLFIYLPDEYNSMGYCHLRELFREASIERLEELSKVVSSLVRLFLPLKIDNMDADWFIHKDDNVRVEAFRHVTDVCTARRFLLVNQFNYDLASLRLLVSYFREFMRRAVLEEEDGLRSVYSDVVTAMIESRNMARRLFGALLVDLFMEHGLVSSPSWSRLLFDKAHEIRECVKKHARTLNLSNELLMEKILGHESYEIEGAISYIEAKDGNTEEAKREFDHRLQYFIAADDKRIAEFPIYGLIHLLSRQQRYDISESIGTVFVYCFRRLAGVADGELESSARLVVCWRNLRECCYFYYLSILRGAEYRYLDNLLMTLLQVAHLGTIFAVSEHLSEIFERLDFSAEELRKIVEACFEHIKEYKPTFRNSGGLSMVFLAVLRNRTHFKETFSYVLQEIFRSIEGEDQSLRLHSLNILHKLIENNSLCDKLVQECPVLFHIAFSAVGSKLWPVRNAGTKIFSKIVARTFGSRAQAETCFLLHGDLRELVHEQAVSFLRENNELGLFLALCIYEKMDLTEDERGVVDECAEKGGLLSLKARSVLGSKPFPAGGTRLHLKFSRDIPEEEKLCKILLLLDASSEEERMAAREYVNREVDCTSCSLEYQKHIIVKRLCEMGAVEKAAGLLRGFHDSVVLSSSPVFGDTSTYECFDLEYILSLFATYDLAHVH